MPNNAPIDPNNAPIDIAALLERAAEYADKEAYAMERMSAGSVHVRSANQTALRLREGARLVREYREACNAWSQSREMEGYNRDQHERSWAAQTALLAWARGEKTP